MGTARWVRVVAVEPIGGDSVLTLEDPTEPGWPGGAGPFKLGCPGRAYAPGAFGYLRIIPERSYPRRDEGWAFRPIETGREDMAGMPDADGSAPPGAIGRGF